jgi:hypothetical protein
MRTHPQSPEIASRINAEIARRPELPAIDLDIVERLSLAEAALLEQATLSRLVDCYLDFQSARQIRQHLTTLNAKRSN